MVCLKLKGSVKRLCLSEQTSPPTWQGVQYLLEERLCSDKAERLRLEQLCLSERKDSSIGESMGYFLEEGLWSDEVERLRFKGLERLGFEQLSVCLSKHLRDQLSPFSVISPRDRERKRNDKRRNGHPRYRVQFCPSKGH